MKPVSKKEKIPEVEQEPTKPQKVQEKSLERVEEEDEETDEEFYTKMHEGLVKIQALVRGVIARKSVKLL